MIQAMKYLMPTRILGMKNNATTAENEPNEPILTEFIVTETYYIKARTREEAYQMVADNDFKYGINKHNVNIEVNF